MDTTRTFLKANKTYSYVGHLFKHMWAMIQGPLDFWELSISDLGRSPPGDEGIGPPVGIKLTCGLALLVDSPNIGGALVGMLIQ